MTPDHVTVLAAIDKARRTQDGKYGLIAEDWLRDRNAHCDDLLATTGRHGVQTPEYTEPNGGATVTECEHCGLYWPCPDYQQVIDRLTWWGLLTLRRASDG